jgi:hypothetical protein
MSPITPFSQNMEELGKSLRSASVVRCDEIPFQLLGISLAGYGAMLSAFLAVISGFACLGISIKKGVFCIRCRSA